MPVCDKCNTHFPNRVRIEGKVRHLGKRKFCLDCSPFGRHNTLDLTKHRLEDSKVCPICNLPVPLKDYYTRSRKSGEPHSYCKKCVRDKATERLQQMKQRAVNTKGGKCCLCGYDKYIGALEFHHLDPTMKDDTITSLRWRSFETTMKEIEKCILICANCHREVHGGLHPGFECGPANRTT